MKTVQNRQRSIRNFLLFLAFTAVCFCAAARIGAQSPAQKAAPKSGTDEIFSIQVGGAERRYLLHLPASYDKNKPTPLVFIFHGGGGTPQSARRLGFGELSDKKGFILVYPEGIRGWNDGRQAYFQVNDDVGFVRAMIERLKKTLNVDPNRIYAAGNSNGGIFSQRLACELSDELAAVASGAGTMPEKIEPTCKPQNPISVLAFHGTDDQLVPFDGGIAGRAGTVLSVLKTIAKWVELNDCRSTPQVTKEPDTDPQDGTRVRRELYAPCKKGGTVEVLLYVIEGGGHAWAGMRGYSNPESGRVSRDINAAEIAWDFFVKHPKSKNK